MKKYSDLMEQDASKKIVLIIQVNIKQKRIYTYDIGNSKPQPALETV